ncbi:MAG: ABC transporter permease [Coriobacteriales bacterium]|jgi:ABC-2 type transport system permease protein|nr:ABC transporter permease [Coriobacteriales bacterium]
MPAFKTAIRLIFRFPVFLLVYIVGLGLFGVAITASNTGTATAEEAQLTDEAIRPSVAVIDRDGSELSEGIHAFYTERTTPVAVEDTTLALQTATAQDLASYIVIIPEGYGVAFREAARSAAAGGSETAAPALQTIVNYAQSDAVYMDLLTQEYLSVLRIAAIAEPDATDAEILERAATASNLHASYDIVETQVEAAPSELVSLYFSWLSYPMTAGLIVLTSVIFGTFQSGELRRRNLCSPLSPSKMNTQIAAGCVALVLMTWLFLVLLSLLPVCGGLELFTQNPTIFLLFALAALVLAFMPFSLGFLLSQLGLREMASNGVANIVGLAFSFLSGVFMGGTQMLGEGIQAVAHAIPTYWYLGALEALVQGGTSAEALTGYSGNLGVVVLFSIVLFALALLIGHRRAQNAEAGGNPAAEQAA